MYQFAKTERDRDIAAAWAIINDSHMTEAEMDARWVAKVEAMPKVLV